MNDNNIINKSKQILISVFGENVADMYFNYYQDKSETDILQSVNELLTEAMGPEAANKRMKIFFNKKI